MTASQVRDTFDRILAKARDLQSLVPGNPVESSIACGTSLVDSESEKVMAVTLDPHPTAICPGR